MQIEGLCGNMDEDITNEFTTEAGVLGPVNEFGDSFADPSCRGCSEDRQSFDPCSIISEVS